MMQKVKMLQTAKLWKKMNKNESTNPEDIETSEEVPEETSDNEEAHSVPLEQYEKIKDDYLRLAADFENFKICCKS